MGKPQPLVSLRVRRLAVRWAIQEKSYTQRRACRLVGLEPKTYRYATKRPDDAVLRQRFKDPASQRRRFGYRRLCLLLRREGVQVNHKRTYRVYRELGLQLRAKTPKRRVRAKLREDRCPAVMPNQTCAMDFVHDQLALGRKIRVLTVVDIFSKFSPAIDPRFSYR